MTSRTNSVVFTALCVLAAASCVAPDASELGQTSAALACAGKPGVICTWAGTGEFAFNGDGKPLLESALYWPEDLTFHPDGRSYIVDWNNHRIRLIMPDRTLKTVIGTDFIGDGPEDLSDQTPPGAMGTTVNLNHPTQLVAVPGGKPILVAWHNHKLREYDPETGLVTVVGGGPAGFKGDGGPLRKAQLNQPNQMVVAEDGTWYVLDQRNQIIRSVSSDGMLVETVAGTPTKAGFRDGDASSAQFSFPNGSNPPSAGGIAVAGRLLYIADTSNHAIRLIDLDAKTVATIAGNGEPGFSGDGGPAIDAQLNRPHKLAIGPDARLYISDQYNHRIRAIDLTAGTIETVAGNGTQGFSGDGGPATEAALNRPSGVAFGPDGSMYVLDTFNSRIRQVPAGDR